MIIDKLSTEDWGSGGSSETSRGLGVASAVAAAVGVVGVGVAGIARGIHAGKSPGEWSAGESLLMLEDACKNERKHSTYFSLLRGVYLSSNIIFFFNDAFQLNVLNWYYLIKIN